MSPGLTGEQQNAAGAVRKMQEWAHHHGEWRARSCINLVAANNVMSAAARAALASRLADKPVSGSLGHRHHTGSRYVDLIETAVVDLAKELFRASAVEYRPVSGDMANAVATRGVLRPGDTVLLLPPGAPCHDSHRVYTACTGARVVDIPYDYQEFDVDLDGLRRVARTERPRLIAVGTALMLFPYRLRELRAIADEVGALVWYDAAHPLGLIAGGQFQDPLEEGAHLVTASTQKTLPGPIGGLVMARDEGLGRAMARAAGELMSNYHNNRVLALGITLAETRAFGREYAAACLENARALAGELAEQGLTMVGARKGYTRSNMVILEVSDPAGSEPLARAWEAANLMVSIVRVPSPDPQPGRPPDGLRIGVQEMTRRGMGAGEMVEIARLLARIARGEPPERAGREVADLAERFQEVYYCFEAPMPPSP